MKKKQILINSEVILFSIVDVEFVKDIGKSTYRLLSLKLYNKDILFSLFFLYPLKKMLWLFYLFLFSKKSSFRNSSYIFKSFI